MEYFRRIVKGSASLLGGMRVTLAALFTKPITQEYPREKPEMSKAFRSAIKLIRFEDLGTHDCIACLLCEKICPSFCIKIDGYKPEGIKRKRATQFDMDFALCSLCGLCIDVCPTVTLEYSTLYDIAGYKKDQWTFDLLDGFQEDEEAYLARAREEAVKVAAEKERLRAEKLAAKKAAKEKAAAEEAAAPAEPAAAEPTPAEADPAPEAPGSDDSPAPAAAPAPAEETPDASGGREEEDA